MRLSILAVLAPLVARAAADSVIQEVYCYPTYCDYTNAQWDSAFGAYHVDMSDGCRNEYSQVPGLNTLCVDWSHERAHFYFDNQGKRCLHLDTWFADTGCSNSQQSCYAASWSEVTCTW